MSPVAFFFGKFGPKNEKCSNFREMGTIVNSSLLNIDISIEILDIFTCYIFGQMFPKLKNAQELGR